LELERVAKRLRKAFIRKWRLKHRAVADTIYQELNPTARRGGDRRSSKAQVGSKKSFASATASATARSTTAVNRAVTRGDKIADEVLAMGSGDAD
jgi:hypothetical protein